MQGLQKLSQCLVILNRGITKLIYMLRDDTNPKY